MTILETSFPGLLRLCCSQVNEDWIDKRWLSTATNLAQYFNKSDGSSMTMLKKYICNAESEQADLEKSIHEISKDGPTRKRSTDSTFHHRTR